MRYLLLCLLLVGCGSGAVSAPPTFAPLTVTPASAVVYSGQPTTFQIEGGTGNYVVTSSDQATIPLAGSPSGHTLTVVPRAVNAEGPVVLIVTDDAKTSTVQVSLTVKPTTVQNTVTITPTVDTCNPGVCTGSDAVVVASLIVNNVPIANAPVRFEVLSGSASFNGQPTFTTATDISGRARATVQVAPSAATQTIVLRITDIQSGSFQTASFQAVQTPGFMVTPQTITFSGPDNSQCASGLSTTALVTIFGGSPPYRILGAGSGVVVDPDVVGGNGGSFRIIPTGACITDQPITVLDSAGRTVFVRVSNVRGTADPTPLAISPQTAAIDTCDAQVTFIATGGNGSYLAVPSNNSIVQIAQSGNQFTFRRAPRTTSPPQISVTFVSGNASTGAAITVATAAQGVCP